MLGCERSIICSLAPSNLIKELLINSVNQLQNELPHDSYTMYDDKSIIVHSN